MSRQYVLAIDQGTTSSRAIVFDRDGPQRRHRPEGAARSISPRTAGSSTIPRTSGATRWRSAGRRSRPRASAPTDIAAIGITNQRETTVLWERGTGSAVHRAIVWQDRRTAELCRRLVADGLEEHVRARTGLVVDAYFSGTKLAWLLDHVPGARHAAEHGELAFGTIDSLLLWRLTGGRVHATDATNASRTMLFDIVDQRWDDELLAALRIPRRGAAARCATAPASSAPPTPTLFGAAIPILGIAGDQQAATVGQACFAPGMSKSTYGTGCFMLVNTGERCVASRQPAADARSPTGSAAGRPTRSRAASSSPARPCSGCATGCGVIARRRRERGAGPRPADRPRASISCRRSPAWAHRIGIPDARGAILGLTRDSGVAHIVRAALEAVAYQTARPRRRRASPTCTAAPPTPASARCGSTAAWWSTTGCASSWPTCSTGRWSGRR